MFDFNKLEIDYDKIKKTTSLLQKSLESLNTANTNLKRKVKVLHECLFDKPDEIVKILKTDGLLMSYLDRVYQKDILDYKRLEERVKNLICRDNRVKRSHSFDYLPSNKDVLNSEISIKIHNHKHVYQNEYDDFDSHGDKQYISNYLTSYETKPIENVRQNKPGDVRKSLNQPFSNKVDSFVITSANNSFVRDHNENDWYSSKTYKSTRKHQTRTPMTKDTDKQFSRVYGRASDVSNINDQSRMHRRIASDDLILEENSDIPRIEYQKPDAADFDADISAILKDLHYILTRSELDPITEEEFLAYSSHSHRFHKQVWYYANEILKALKKKIEEAAYMKDLQRQLQKISDEKSEVSKRFEEFKELYPLKSFGYEQTQLNKDLSSERQLLNEIDQRLKLQKQLNDQTYDYNKLADDYKKLQEKNIQSLKDKENQEMVITYKHENEVLKRENSSLLERIDSFKEKTQVLKSKIADKERQIEELKRDYEREIRNIQSDRKLRSIFSSSMGSALR